MHHTKGILPKQCQTFFPKFWSTFINKKTITTCECLIFAFAVYPSENNVLSEYKMLIGDIFSDTVWVGSVCPIFVLYLFELDQDNICSILKIAFSSMKEMTPCVFSKNSLTNYHNETFYWHRRCS